MGMSQSQLTVQEVQLMSELAKLCKVKELYLPCYRGKELINLHTVFSSFESAQWAWARAS